MASSRLLRAEALSGSVALTVNSPDGPTPPPQATSPPSPPMERQLLRAMRRHHHYLRRTTHDDDPDNDDPDNDDCGNDCNQAIRTPGKDPTGEELAWIKVLERESSRVDLQAHINNLSFD